MTPIDILVAGGAAIDYTIRAETFPSQSRPVSGDTFLRDCGGKGFNQAVGGARLGERISLAFRVKRRRDAADPSASGGVDD